MHDVEAWREHYARTTWLWHDRLSANRAAAEREVGSEKTRLWIAYLAVVSMAFAQGSTGIFQTLTSRRVRGSSLAELGLAAAKGREGVHQLVTVVTECGGERLPSNARFACQAIVTQLHAVQIEISGLDKRITQTHRVNADSKRLDTIFPGFGVDLIPTAVVATMIIERRLQRQHGSPQLAVKRCSA